MFAYGKSLFLVNIDLRVGLIAKVWVYAVFFALRRVAAEDLDLCMVLVLVHD